MKTSLHCGTVDCEHVDDVLLGCCSLFSVWRLCILNLSILRFRCLLVLLSVAISANQQLAYIFGRLAGVIDLQQLGVHSSGKNGSKRNNDVYAREFQYTHVNIWKLNSPAMDHHMILESTICELIDATTMPTTYFHDPASIAFGSVLVSRYFSNCRVAKAGATSKKLEKRIDSH